MDRPHPKGGPAAVSAAAGNTTRAGTKTREHVGGWSPTYARTALMPRQTDPNESTLSQAVHSMTKIVRRLPIPNAEYLFILVLGLAFFLFFFWAITTGQFERRSHQKAEAAAVHLVRNYLSENCPHVSQIIIPVVELPESDEFAAMDDADSWGVLLLPSKEGAVIAVQLLYLDRAEGEPFILRCHQNIRPHTKRD